MNHIRDYPPYFKLLSGLYDEIRDSLSFCSKDFPSFLKNELFDCEFSIYYSDHDFPGHCIQCFIYDQNISVMDASTGHGMSFHPDEKGSSRMLDELFVEVYLTLNVIIGWARKASGNG